jgi:hypothetical protein
VLGGLGILALLLWRLGTGAFLDGLHVINGGTLLAAAGIGLLTTVLSAWRWSLVARGLGIWLPLVAPSLTITGRCFSTRRCRAASSGMCTARCGMVVTLATSARASGPWSSNGSPARLRSSQSG